MQTDELRIEISADTGSAAQNISSTANALNGLGENARIADNDMSGLVKAMSDAAANMVQVSQSIAASASGLTGFHTGLDSAAVSLQNLDLRFDVLNSTIRQSYSAFDGAVQSVSNLSNASQTSASSLNNIVDAAGGFSGRMSELQISTRETADRMAVLHRELSEALGTIRGFSDNMSSAGKDAQDAASRIKELSEQVKRMPTQQPDALAQGFGKLKGIVATLGVGKFIKDSNDAYNVQMQNELKLTSHMKHRMNATDDEIQSIKDLASAQQQIGIIGDEIQLAGAQQLTTYARQSSTLKTLIPAMNNLIAQNAGYCASTGDATSAADMLGRALNGQYTSLKRMGVTFTEAQENVLKYGNEQQKAAVLADAINSKVGNMNELLSQTPTGKLKQLQNDFGDLQEQLGATFQPLISAIVPVARNVLETLAPPIMNISRGIVTVGSAIASIDSPAVRGIALAVGGAAAFRRLSLAVGGTSAGLLLLGVILTGIIGSIQQEQQSIGDIVSDAYNSMADATGEAAGAVSDYNDELGNTEKAINRLAGFDTVTKLSGKNSEGALTKALLGESGIDDILAATSAAGELGDTLNGITVPDIQVNTAEAFGKIQQFASDAAEVFIHWGDDDAVYAPLSRMTQSIEDLLNAAGLDGTGFVDFWKGIGSDIYEVLNGDSYKGLSGITNSIENILNAVGLDGTAFVNFWKQVGEDVQTDWSKGLEAIDEGFRGTFGAIGEAWSDYWKGFGEDLSDFVQMWQAVGKGDFGTAQAYLMKMQTTNPILSQETKDALEKTGNAILSGDSKNANFYANEAMKGYQTQISDFRDFWNGVKEKNPLNPSFYGLDYQKGVDDFFSDAGDWLGKTIRGIQDYNVGVYSGQRDIFNNPIEQNPTDYRDIPVNPSGASASVSGEVNNYISVYVDGEEKDARVENAKG